MTKYHPLDINILAINESQYANNVNAALRSDFSVEIKKVDPSNFVWFEPLKPSKVVIIIIEGSHRRKFLELCSTIKLDDKFNVSELIVLDKINSLEEKMEVYEVGASDLVIYPCDDIELVKKVSLSIFRVKHLDESALQAKSAMDTAMNAIMDAGEMGSVVHFLRDSFSCKTAGKLADLLIESALRFGLASSVQIRTSWDVINRTSSDTLSPLEIEMLNALQSAGRIHQKGKRLLMHFGPISLIIKNLPEEDQHKCGRLRDHLALILEGANSRLQSLIMVDELKNLMHETNETISDLHVRDAGQKKQNVKIMDDMLEEIQSEFFRHGLTEEQEAILIAMVDKYVEKIFGAYEAGLKVDDEMNNIVGRIQRVLNKMDLRT